MKIEIIETDLWREREGWTMNGCWVNRTVITMPDTATNLQLSRAIRAASGYAGDRRMRVDSWASADWSWRKGCIGLYADVIEH